MARGQFTVEIEHTRYKPLLDSADRRDGSVKLTTIEAGQQRAVINVFYEASGKRTKTTDFEVIVARESYNEYPDLRLDGAWTGRRKAQLKLYMDGRFYADREVRVPGLSPVFLLIPVAIVLILGLAWFLRPTDPTATTVVSREPVSRPAVEPARAQPTPQADTADTSRSHVPAAQTPSEPTAPATEALPQQQTEPADPQPVTPSSPPATPPPTEPEAVATVAAEQLEFELSVYFQADSAVITPTARQEIESLAEKLPTRTAQQSRISGHAALAGPPAGRLPLSRRRAEAVSALLLTLGVDFGSDVQVRGYGSGQPRTRNPETQDENRRVDIELLYSPES